MTVRHRSASVDEFIENHSHDISRGGMFINTTTPFPPGTLLKFEVRIAGERRVLQGVGRVLWKRDTPGAGDQQPAGMGIKFIKIDPETRDIIDRLVSNRPDTKAAFETGAQTAGIDLNPASIPSPSDPKPAGFPKPKPTQIGLGAVRVDQTLPVSLAPAPVATASAELTTAAAFEPAPAIATLPMNAVPQPVTAASPNAAYLSSTLSTPEKASSAELKSDRTAETSLQDESPATATVRVGAAATPPKVDTASSNQITPSAPPAVAAIETPASPPTATIADLPTAKSATVADLPTAKPTTIAELPTPKPSPDKAEASEVTPHADVAAVTPKRTSEPAQKPVPAHEAPTSRPPTVSERAQRLAEIVGSKSNPRKEPEVITTRASEVSDKEAQASALAATQPILVTPQEKSAGSDAPEAAANERDPYKSVVSTFPPKKGSQRPEASQTLVSATHTAAPTSENKAPMAIVRGDLPEEKPAALPEAPGTKSESSFFLWATIAAIVVVGVGVYLLFNTEVSEPSESSTPPVSAPVATSQATPPPEPIKEPPSPSVTASASPAPAASAAPSSTSTASAASAASSAPSAAPTPPSASAVPEAPTAAPKPTAAHSETAPSPPAAPTKPKRKKPTHVPGETPSAAPKPAPSAEPAPPSEAPKPPPSEPPKAAPSAGDDNPY
jgi:uncharacterized protein (TIGR02266 family)